MHSNQELPHQEQLPLNTPLCKLPKAILLTEVKRLSHARRDFFLLGLPLPYATVAS
jgi:hypothetical protein